MIYFLRNVWIGRLQVEFALCLSLCSSVVGQKTGPHTDSGGYRWFQCGVSVCMGEWDSDYEELWVLKEGRKHYIQ